MTEAITPLVGVIMGSKSDWETMKLAVDVLDRFAVPHECRVVSAHRTPAFMAEYASAAEERGLEVLMVGDYLYDLQAGRSAGTRTALVTHGRDLPFAPLADVAFASFEDLPEALRSWLGDGD